MTHQYFQANVRQKDKNMKTTITTAILAALLLARMTTADDLLIESMSGGTISWSDIYTTGHYRVEWAPQPNASWRWDWNAQLQVPATGGTASAEIPMFFRVVHFPPQSYAIDTELILVPGGGQAGGPEYDFYMARHETTEAEFLTFLNDAQANTNNALGMNMFFADSGNVYMDSSLTANELLFDISKSSLIYSKSLSPGSRYSGFLDRTNHPITGVSWYGAVKYCNWLSIYDGRGESSRCYAEGTSPTNWHPANVTYSSWIAGYYISDRLDWVNNYQGFRLPMDQYSGSANYFNEFYKAAAWNGSSNTTYAYGRNTWLPQDMNYSGSGDPFESRQIKTTPVGYYNGSDHGGTYQTRTNQNYYLIHDLSGNVWEWQSDAWDYGRSDMARRSGSWGEGGDPGYFACSYRLTRDKHYADQYLGFRIVTTYP